MQNIHKFKNKIIVLIIFLQLMAISCYAIDEELKLQKIDGTIIPNITLNSRPAPYVYISIIIKTGQANESNSSAGLSGLITNMLLNETKNKSAQEVEQIFYNNSGGMTVTSHQDYSEIKLVTRKQSFREAIRIIGECMSEPKFSDETVKKAKDDAFKGMIEEYATPFQQTYDRFRYNIYETIPYKRSIYGLAQSIKNVDMEQIAYFFHENFNPNEIIISIVGDLTPEEVKQTISNSFFRRKPIPPKRAIYEYEEKLQSNKAETIINNIEDDKQLYYMIGWLAPKVNSPDYYKVLLLKTIIGSGKSARLFKKMRQENGYGYSIGCQYPELKRQSHLYIYISTIYKDADKITIIRKLINSITDDLKSNAVSEKELKRAKNYLIGQTELQNEDLLNLAHNIALAQANNTDYLKWTNQINNITAEDIKDMANKYLTYSTEVICIPKNN